MVVVMRTKSHSHTSYKTDFGEGDTFPPDEISVPILPLDVLRAAMLGVQLLGAAVSSAFLVYEGINLNKAHVVDT